MKFAIRTLTALAITTTAAFTSPLPLVVKPATAVQFQQQEVNQSQFVVVAAPAGSVGHQLLILEQVSNQRPCWRDSSNGLIDPLLVNFDFTGICSRSTDSNGYSVRVGGEDLGWRYSLRVVEEGNDLVLVANSTTDRNSPPIEIGRTNGITGDFAQISLAPGWRLTRRTYNGQAIGHVYLTNDRDLATLIASASPIRPPVTTPPIAPPSTSRPTPSTPERPSAPERPSTGRPSHPPAAANDLALQLGFSYRVVVRPRSDADQARVRAIAPDAFWISMDNEAVMQAGLFRDRNDAASFERQIDRERLDARVIRIEGSPTGNTASRPTQPTRPTQPSTPSQPTTPSTDLPRVPNSSVVVMVDPGHGGVDVGAVGIGGLKEADINLDISRQVASLLQRQGVQAILTRQDDREIDLAPRVAQAERSDADIFVSIHSNAATTEANGVETYYYSSGARLAQSIQSSIVNNLDVIDRGVKQARFYVLTQTSMPSALVEVGFVTGRQDAARLSTASFRSQMADAIARGILQYVQQNGYTASN
jgi:N-acetylmuramoyl-L-alanine amidase